MSEINIGNTIFNGFNDKHGIMICGYEWGWSKKDEENEVLLGKKKYDDSIPITFSCKSGRYGDSTPPYEQKIIKWFSLWGHDLKTDDIDDSFSKTIIQTNWSNSCSNKTEDIYGLCLSVEAIDNFIYHVSIFKPKIILFMGSELNNLIRSELVFHRLVEIVGPEIEKRKILQKEYDGVRFKVGFNYFRDCTIVSFPHPSARSGVPYDYISLFKEEMDPILQSFKCNGNFS